MCGIIGYTGHENATPYLVSGLEALEYRGYDSVGIAEECGGDYIIVKTKGKIERLKKLLENTKAEKSVCGIGHTRWATNGEPSEANAHPHRKGDTVIVHNGIIENDRKLIKSLGEYEFESETDTEVAAALIDKRIKERCCVGDGIFAAVREMTGSYAFVVMHKSHPGELYAIRKKSPLIAAETKDGLVFASDVTAVMSECDEFYRIPEDTLAVAGEDGLKFFDESGEEVLLKPEKILWSRDAAEKNGFPHYMLKEINEEPEVIEKTAARFIKDGIPDFSEAFPEDTAGIHIVACGSAMHAGIVGKYVIEKLARIPVSVDTASEFRYREPAIAKNTVLILISQSGETADTLAALRYAKERGVKTSSIVNVPGSSLANESDTVLYTEAGPEIAVATTKAYMTQCEVLYLAAVYLAYRGGRISRDECERLTSVMREQVPKAVAAVIADNNSKEIAEKIAGAEHLFYIGRGIDSAVCIEASLKLKEISYLHSEAYAAGELKHGTISLVENGTPVIAVITDSKLADKTMMNLAEVKARGAAAYVFSSVDGVKSDAKLPHVSDKEDIFDVFPMLTYLQLLAYHTSLTRGCDVDQPRNLAKSVTVE